MYTVAKLVAERLQVGGGDTGTLGATEQNKKKSKGRRSLWDTFRTESEYT